MADERKLLAEWFWTDRWMGSSAFLLPLEPRGLYREMLTQAWRRGASLPNDHEAIRRAVGCTAAEWRRCWPVVERFWRQDGDALVNDTQAQVYRDAQAVQERASSRGRKGAQARAQALAQAKHKHPLKDEPPSPSPSPISLERTPAITSARAFSRSASPAGLSGDLAERAGRFVERYAELYQQHRHGARYLGKPNLDWLEAVELCRTWDDARLSQLAEAFLTTDHEFAEKGSRTMAQFRAMASWCDSQLIKAGIA